MAVKKVAAKPASRSIAGEQLGALMGLLAHVDSVELKAVVPMEAHRATVAKLGLDPVEAEVRQVFFFDTARFELNRAGLVVRARRIAGGGGDTVVKLRPVDPATVDRELRRSGSFKTEVDVVPGGFVCSGSLKGKCTGREVLDATRGRMSVDELFSREQHAYFAEHAPAGIALGSLVAFGPILVLKALRWVKRLDRRLVVEAWFYPDGSRNLEISAKCGPSELVPAATELKEYLAGLGVRLTAGQQTKTRAAMEFFRAELRRGDATRRRPA